VRGVANVYPMTAETAMQLGRALAHSIRRGSHRHRVVIGKDTRLSGYMLEQSLAAGICSMGVDVVLVGPLPTPGISFITKSQRADAGAVISASHNPYQDNGIKFFSRDGFKLPDETEAELEALIFNNAIDHLRPTATKIGKAFRLDDAAGRYVEYLKNSFPSDLTLDGLTLVVDCANGAGYRVGPAVFEELGAKVVRLGVKPDGKNINARCGALFPEQLCRAVLKEKAHLGIALDGDADRVIVSDERGQVLDGEAVMAVCARDMARRGTLKNDVVVTTVMSSLGLDMSLRPLGVRVLRTQVGDRYVVEEMRRSGANFGGEQSGHLVFLDHATTGDGTLAALRLLSIMVAEQKPLSSLTSMFTRVPQRLVNVQVKERRDLSTLSSVQDAIADAERELAPDGRVLVRFSGTEAKVRILVEGPNEPRNQSLAERIAGEVRAALG
jgi:phosphoglucosamine mutase